MKIPPKATFEITTKNDCLADCSYCSKLHRFSQQRTEVSPLHNTFVACNNLKHPLISSTTIRRLNTRLFNFYEKSQIPSPCQWLIDGKNPSLDQIALNWALNNHLVDSLLLIIRPGADYSFVLSYLEKQESIPIIFIISELKGDHFNSWLNKCEEFYPHTYQKFEYTTLSSNTFSAPLFYKPQNKVSKPSQIKLSLIICSNEDSKSFFCASIKDRNDLELIQITSSKHMTCDHTLISSKHPDNCRNFALEICRGERVALLNHFPSDQEINHFLQQERFEASVLQSKGSNTLSADRLTLLHSNFPMNNLDESCALNNSAKLILSLEKLSLKVTTNYQVTPEIFRLSPELEQLLTPILYKKYFTIIGGHTKIREIMTRYLNNLLGELVVALLFIPIGLLKLLSDLSYRSTFGTGSKINFSWVYWAIILTKHRFIWSFIWPLLSTLRKAIYLFTWSILWPLSYPTRKVYYYLEYKLKKQ